MTAIYVRLLYVGRSSFSFSFVNVSNSYFINGNVVERQILNHLSSLVYKMILVMDIGDGGYSKCVVNDRPNMLSCATEREPT